MILTLGNKKFDIEKIISINPITYEKGYTYLSEELILEPSVDVYFLDENDEEQNDIIKISQNTYYVGCKCKYECESAEKEYKRCKREATECLVEAYNEMYTNHQSSRE